MFRRLSKIIEYYKVSRVMKIVKIVIGDKKFERLFPRDEMTKKVVAHASLKEAFRELSEGLSVDIDGLNSDLNESNKLEDMTNDTLKALANKYFTGDGVECDQAKAITYWQEASNRGDIEASLNIATCLKDGTGIGKDVEKSFLMMLPLVESYQHPVAHYSVAIMYNTGVGTPIDEKKAFDHFKAAAKLGVTPSIYNLGNMYAAGRGVDKSEEAALACYELAADSGDTNAQFTLGNWISEGRGGAVVDVIRAASLTLKAAQKGHGGAAHNVGLLYLAGQAGFPQDHVMAARWFTTAASKGLMMSQYNLGKMYKDGDGVPKDLKKALFYFSKLTSPSDDMKELIRETENELLASMETKVETENKLLASMEAKV